VINLGALTDLMIDQLDGGGLLVGDGVAPKPGGWEKGSPNVDRFVHGAGQ
jgi:hypothetical protein